ncbi:hypothetical protein SDC9_45955 [bioreactor metagenome]|uniref:Uncharacterized protein n=1 Tax=bioreactor metagenome TaxID=1076179 RepID=A0A644W7F2_9ZZZZ
MAKPQSSKETFVIQILNQQNSTWQGVITWTEGRTSQPFRSLLELIKLIDSALGESSGESHRIEWNTKKQPIET